MPRLKQVKVNRDMTARNLAKVLGVHELYVLRELFLGLEVMRTLEETVELEYAREVAINLGHELIEDDEECSGEMLDVLPDLGPPPKAPPKHRNDGRPPRRPRRLS